MTREQKIVKAQRLREQGLGYKPIAQRLSVGTGTVYRWLNPDYAERERSVSREWKRQNKGHVRAYDHRYGREHRGTCQECGGEMGIHITADGVCRSCRVAAKEEAWDYIERRYAEGALRREIAAELGWTRNHISAQCGRMRAAGRLPYRRKAYEEKAKAA